MSTGFKNINIERYPNPDETGYSSVIEGSDNVGNSWVMWLNSDGTPEVFWGHREEDGSVVGDGIPLTAEGQRREGYLRAEKMRQILSDPDPAAVVKRLQGSLDAVDRYRSGDSRTMKDWEHARKVIAETTTPPNVGGKPIPSGPAPAADRPE